MRAPATKQNSQFWKAGFTFCICIFPGKEAVSLVVKRLLNRITCAHQGCQASKHQFSTPAKKETKEFYNHRIWKLSPCQTAGTVCASLIFPIRYFCWSNKESYQLTKNDSAARIFRPFLIQVAPKKERKNIEKGSLAALLCKLISFFFLPALYHKGWLCYKACVTASGPESGRASEKDDDDDSVRAAGVCVIIKRGERVGRPL
jgi:hypothetical protein